MEFYGNLQSHAGFYIHALKDVDFDQLEKEIAEEETRRKKPKRASRGPK